jgi:thiamine-monophosphate kinase
VTFHLIAFKETSSTHIWRRSVLTGLEALGERRAIELIIEELQKMPAMPIPFGDDVSAFNVGGARLAILKTDMLVGKTDVPPNMNVWQASRKAVVMNVSDFAAKGVKPEVLVVSLGLPRKLKMADLKEIGKGLNAGAREYGAYVVGGDTGEASDLVISVSLFGLANRNEVILRSGAQPGDILAVTGSFGRTSAGLRILSVGLKVPQEIRSVLVDSVLMPHARLNEGIALSQTEAVTAGIDCSDGLAWSLHEIGEASGVGFVIDTLPIAREAKLFAEICKTDFVELVFYGGEEYELVLTVKPNLWRKAEKAVQKVGGTLLAIGRVTADERALLQTDGKMRVIEPRGYEHFKTQS